MSRRRDLFVLLFFLLILFLFFYVGIGLMSPQGSFDELTLSGDKIGLIRIVGPIYDSRSVLEKLRKFEENPTIKAILVRLETPGGGVAASQEIYQRLRYLHDEKHLPIVASMAGIAASGGYYIALAADTIVANPGTVTGSIGVIAEFPNFDPLLEKIGIRFEVIKTGKFKDTGSPYHPMSAEERQYIQDLINDMFSQFVEAVAEARGMETAQVEALADGRVFTGQQAKELGLIDVLGGMDDARRIAGEMAGIKGTPRLVELHDRKLTLFDLLLGDLEELAFSRLGLTTPLKYQMPRYWR